jgi:hypothetical protein
LVGTGASEFTFHHGAREGGDAPTTCALRNKRSVVDVVVTGARDVQIAGADRWTPQHSDQEYTQKVEKLFVRRFARFAPGVMNVSVRRSI